MKVKILDTDLIRRFGGSCVEMNVDLAVSMQKRGKVKILDDYDSYCIGESGDSETVLILANNKKEENKIAEGKKFPDVDDPIFPQIKA